MGTDPVRRASRVRARGLRRVHAPDDDDDDTADVPDLDWHADVYNDAGDDRDDDGEFDDRARHDHDVS